MKVQCEIIQEEIENDEGHLVDGISAECERCGHCTESFGTSSASIRRCLVLMREECPNGENNFYESEKG